MARLGAVVVNQQQTPPERFPLSDRPGHDVHWTLAAELVKRVWARHNATFAAVVKEWYGAPAKNGESDHDE
jgi:hypothetical protein